MSGQQKEYIDTALNPFLKEIIPEVLLKKPDEPIQFMIDWLRTKLGYPKKMTGKEELSFLRQELARLKQVKNTGSEGELSNSDKGDEVDDLEFTAKIKLKSTDQQSQQRLMVLGTAKEVLPQDLSPKQTSRSKSYVSDSTILSCSRVLTKKIKKSLSLLWKKEKLVQAKL